MSEDIESVVSTSAASISVASTANPSELGPPFDRPVEGAPDTLKCDQCKNAWAEIRCPCCGEGAFCSAMCLWKATNGADEVNLVDHLCIGGYETSADELCQSIVMDEEFDSYTHVQFFCYCSLRDMERFRPVYWFIHTRLLVTKYQLDNWRRGNVIYRNIIRMINRNLDSVPPHVFAIVQGMDRIFQYRENTREKPDVERYNQLKECGQTGLEPRVQRP